MTFPAGNDSGWRSPARSSANAACCWPTSRPGASDSTNGELVMRMLRTACQGGLAGIVVTHDAQLASWADRVVFIRDGRIIDQTSPAPGPESLLGNGATA